MNDESKYKAFDEGRMDEFLRQTVEGHRIEPDPGLWKAISRKLLWREISRLNFKNLTARYWAAGVAGLLVITSVIYLGLPASNHIAPDVSSTGGREASTSAAIPNTGNVAMTYTHPVSQTSVSLTKNVNQSLLHDDQTGNNLINSQADKFDISSNPSSGEKSLTFRENPKDNAANASSGVTHPIGEVSIIPYESRTPIPFSEMEISRLVPYNTTLVFSPPAGDTILTISTPDGIINFKKETQSTSRFFSVNLGVEPEMSTYAEPDAYSKFNFWINGRLTYHISRFSIATGLGLGYVFDEGKYRIDYQSRDSVGYFTSVVSYTTGTANEIIYKTKTENIYDSLVHMADDRTKNRYTYLQVPLLLGYRLFESNSVSLTFQVGPAISLLIGSHLSEPVINYPNARIIKVEDNTPERVTANWQIWTNLNLEIRMNRKTSFYLEPSFKYFLSPMTVQEKATAKAPWSVGLGIGLQFNLGK